MTADGQSVNAIVPLTVINTTGFTLPKTGGEGMWKYAIVSVLAVAAAGVIVMVYHRESIGNKTRRYCMKCLPMLLAGMIFATGLCILAYPFVSQ